LKFSDDHYNTHELAGLVHHSGILTAHDLRQVLQSGQISVNGQRAQPQMAVAPGDRVLVRGHGYEVCAGGGNQRLQLSGAASADAALIRGKIRVHAGYHKCLTEYAKKIYQRTCQNPVYRNGSFKHYFHRLDAFYADCARHTICSISGHCLDLDRFEDVKVVRFIRDPRDLLVSGYFYHKRGAEHWCALENATDLDWKMVNGAVPASLPANTSLATYLKTASLEDGLRAELAFRRFHFDSMLAWPDSDSRVRVFRYEDILGNEPKVFAAIFDFYGMPLPVRLVARHYASKFRAGQRASNKKHIRNPSSGQWREYFTPDMTRLFNDRYGELLRKYDYPLD
jgi:hypothetical protein